MPNDFFQFKQFTVWQSGSAMKVCTDSCLLGAITIKKLKEDEKTPVNILDIGGGTGLLSLMLAQEFSGANIDCVEIDADACRQMKHNFAESAWQDRLHAIQADIKKFTSAIPYDVIISNPPFYENDLKGSVPSRIAAMHDSHLVFRDLLKVIKGKLSPDGVFYLLIPASREQEVEKLFSEVQACATEKFLIRHADGYPVSRIIYKGSFNAKKESVKIDELNIHQENKYSAEFVELLKNFYLYL